MVCVSGETVVFCYTATMTATNKTQPSKQSPTAFINSLEDAQLKKDCKVLLKLFKKVTGKPAKMWGDSIIGFGSYHYKYNSGREGDFLATGFSPRKSGPTVYIMPGYNDYSELLEKLGPHKLGKSCLYLKNLNNIDVKVLEQLIKQGLKDLKKLYPVSL